MQLSNAKITKNAIVQTAKALLRQKPLEKLSVGEIAEASGVNRNTFYYHFQDKYDILCWIFENELLPVMQPFLENHNLAGSFIALCDVMRTDPTLYTGLFTLSGSVQISLSETIADCYKRYLTSISGKNATLAQLEPQERDSVVRFYSHAIIGLLTDWVNGGMKQDPSEIVAAISDTMGKRIFHVSV